MAERCAHGSWYIQGDGKMRACTHCGYEQRRESRSIAWTEVPDPEGLAGLPLTEPLTQNEETVLLALAQGASMAPIGSWKDALEALATRGLAVKLDEMNYAATPEGRVLAERKDDQFIRGWIKDSNAAAVLKHEGRVEADMTPLLSGAQKACESEQAYRTKFAEEEIQPAVRYNNDMIFDPSVKVTTVYGLTLRQLRELIVRYEQRTGKRASDI